MHCELSEVYSGSVCLVCCAHVFSLLQSCLYQSQSVITVKGFGLFEREEMATGLKSWERCHNRLLNRSQHKPQQLRMAMRHCLLAGKCRATETCALGGSEGLDYPVIWLTTDPRPSSPLQSLQWQFHAMSFLSYLTHRIPMSFSCKQIPAWFHSYHTGVANFPLLMLPSKVILKSVFWQLLPF